MKRLSLYVLLAAAALPAIANDAHHAPSIAQVAASAQLSEGEVKKVDKDAGKITIKHGPLANLDMPAMTMVFRVTDPTMLDRVKAGDQIRFEADRVNGAFLVKRIEAAK